MCLDIEPKYHPEYIDENYNRRKPTAKVATFPILTYKVLDVDKCDKGKVYYTSPYRGTSYKMGTLYRSAFSFDLFDYSIQRGLHSCINVSSANNHMSFSGENFPAIIPVGSKFYLGMAGEIVSNQLIVFPNKKAILEHFNVEAFGKGVSRYNL